MQHLVSLTFCGKYPTTTPFHPDNHFPEYSFGVIGDQENTVYRAIRDNFYLLGLDRRNFNKPTWNPLGKFISPGNTVLIKPNLVRHFHGLGLGLDSLITHGSIVRVVLDYVALALKDDGLIIIGDSPLQQGDIHEVTKAAGINQIVDFLRGKTKVRFEIIDFRKERAFKDHEGRTIKKIRLHGDPRGYTAVNLGSDSALVPIEKDFGRFRVTQYDPDEMPKHHHIGHHEYLIPNSVLKADVFINLPKLKTHRKAGITASLKNLVGINGSKDWLPHHRFGSIKEGGDEYLNSDFRKYFMRVLVEKMDTASNYHIMRIFSVLRKLIHLSRKIRPFRDQYFEGSWYGNDTLPRTIVDLNKVILYADKKGKMQPTEQRHYFALIDGIIGGEKEGPMEPTPKASGVIIAGDSAVLVDTIVATLMGLDPIKIPSIKYALNVKEKYRLTSVRPSEIAIITPDRRLDLATFGQLYHLDFEPSAGWKGAIERPIPKKS